MNSIDDLLAIARQARAIGDFTEAHDALSQALAQLRAAGMPPPAITVLTTLGQVARGMRDHELARRSYAEALALARDAGEPLQLAHVVRHFGDVLSEQHDWVAAEPCYDEALALYRANPTGPRLDLANALRAAAVLKGHMDQPMAARALWAQALPLYQQAGVEAGVTECQRHLSDY